MSGNHAIAGKKLLIHPKVARAMFDELVEFLKCVFIEEKVDPFARGHLAGGVLFFDTGRSPASFCLLLAFTQLIEFRLLLFFL